MEFFELENDALRKIISEAVFELSTILRKREYDLDHIAIANCITLARINKTPIDVSELSRLTNVPRPTLIRKLNAWKKDGVVHVWAERGRTYALPILHGASSPTALATWAEMEDIFLRATQKMTALQTNK